jgi:uncharacterized protein YjbI with pentapeptide repeats
VGVEKDDLEVFMLPAATRSTSLPSAPGAVLERAGQTAPSSLMQRLDAIVDDYGFPGNVRQGLLELVAWAGFHHRHLACPDASGTGIDTVFSLTASASGVGWCEAGMARCVGALLDRVDEVDDCFPDDDGVAELADKLRELAVDAGSDGWCELIAIDHPITGMDRCDRPTDWDPAILKLALQTLDLRGANLSLPPGAACTAFHNLDLAGANLENATLAGIDMENVNLRGASLSGVQADSVRMVKVDLSHCDLSSAELKDCGMRYIDLHEASLKDATLTATDLAYADLSGVDLMGAQLSDIILRGACLIGVFARGARLLRVDLSHAAIGAANLSKAILDNVELNNVVLRHEPEASCHDGPDEAGDPDDPNDSEGPGARPRPPDLSGAILHLVELNRAVLPGLILSHASVTLTRFSASVLTGADLNAARLFHFDLSGADLDGAELDDALLTSGCLIGATLRGATLCAAKLQDVDFRQADLSGVYLIDGVMDRVQLDNSTVARADLSGASLNLVKLLNANLASASLRDLVWLDADFAGAVLDEETELSLHPALLEHLPRENYLVRAILDSDHESLGLLRSIDSIPYRFSDCKLDAMKAVLARFSVVPQLGGATNLIAGIIFNNWEYEDDPDISAFAREVLLADRMTHWHRHPLERHDMNPEIVLHYLSTLRASGAWPPTDCDGALNQLLCRRRREPLADDLFRRPACALGLAHPMRSSTLELSMEAAAARDGIDLIGGPAREIAAVLRHTDGELVRTGYLFLAACTGTALVLSRRLFDSVMACVDGEAPAARIESHDLRSLRRGAEGRYEVVPSADAGAPFAGYPLLRTLYLSGLIVQPPSRHSASLIARCNDAVHNDTAGTIVP